MYSQSKHLFVIDEVPVDAQLLTYFKQFNYSVSCYQSIEQINHKPTPNDAILINWQLLHPHFSQIEQLYHRYTLPIIILSNTTNEAICIQTLEAGADDFIVKPIHPRVLYARLSAISRRIYSRKCHIEKEVFLFANWKLYPSSRQLFNETNQEIKLSNAEYELLLTFVQQPQCVLKRNFLLQITKNHEVITPKRQIDVQISRLRQKIEIDAKKPTLIKTIRNSGYLFASKVQKVDCVHHSYKNLRSMTP